MHDASTTANHRRGHAAVHYIAAHTVHHRPAAAAGVTHPCRSTEGGQIVAGSVAVSASGAERYKAFHSFDPPNKK